MSLLVCFALGFVMQEQGGPPKIKPKSLSSVTADHRPVTCSEASQVFEESRKIVSKALEVTLPLTSRVKSAGRPVTREEVVAEFNQIFEEVAPDFKFKPKTLAFNTALLKIAPSERAPLERLIAYGCVGKVAPLATGPTDAMTPAEFGDAVGLFIARLSELTHMPSPKWTPMLQDQG